MRYITQEDILAAIQEPMLQSGIEKHAEILDTLESGSIDEVCSYIGGRYDCNKIFSEPPVRNGMIQRIITCMVVYRAIRRNAARKVPEKTTKRCTDGHTMPCHAYVTAKCLCPDCLN